MRALVIVAVLVATAGVAQASHCHEVSVILGRRHCGRFANWRHIEIEGLFSYNASLVVGRIGLPALSTAGTAYRANGQAAFTSQITPGQSDTLTAVGTRFHWGFIGRNLTLALELAPMWGVSGPSATTTVEGSRPIVSRDFLVFDASLETGFHTRIADVFSVGVDLATGLRTYEVSSVFPAGYTLCPGGALGRSCDPGLNSSGWLVEVRPRLDWWVTPHMTLGAVIGYDVVGSGETFAAQITFHMAPYDGS